MESYIRQVKNSGQKGITKRKYEQTVRLAAVAMAVEFGLAHTSREMEIPKPTIQTWCKEAGVVAGGAEKERERTERAIEMSLASRERRDFETRERLVELLSVIAEEAARKEIEAILSGESKLPELVGARTRAIHDLELLAGRATERKEETKKVSHSIEEVLEMQRQFIDVIDVEEVGEIEPPSPEV